jgi:hypothetical protein
MALLEPLVGSALAALVLGDRLGPAGLAGAALLLVALVLEPLTRDGGRRAVPACGAGGRCWWAVTADGSADDRDRLVVGAGALVRHPGRALRGRGRRPARIIAAVLRPDRVTPRWRRHGMTER